MEKRIIRSIIKKYFTPEILVDLYLVTLRSDISNNGKVDEIYNILRRENIPFNQLGAGTNRCAVQIDGYAVKIALDRDGQIDNKREFLYTKALQPYVIRVYECSLDGMIMVCEYVQIFTERDFFENQTEMREILKIISEQYMIGDMGISGKNYINWGYKLDHSICILDFAYIYTIKYTQFTCTCGNGQNILMYDRDYNDLICPVCNKKWAFKTLRKRITKKDQENEIGDIRKIGYVVNKPVNEVIANPAFDPVIVEPKNEEEEERKRNKEIRKKLKEMEKTYDYDDVPYSTFEEILDEIKNS